MWKPCNSISISIHSFSPQDQCDCRSWARPKLSPLRIRLTQSIDELNSKTKVKNQTCQHKAGMLRVTTWRNALLLKCHDCRFLIKKIKDYWTTTKKQHNKIKMYPYHQWAPKHPTDEKLPAFWALCVPPLRVPPGPVRLCDAGEAARSLTCRMMLRCWWQSTSESMEIWETKLLRERQMRQWVTQILCAQARSVLSAHTNASTDCDIFLQFTYLRRADCPWSCQLALNF